MLLRIIARFCILLLLLGSCRQKSNIQVDQELVVDFLELSFHEANRLALLPLDCLEKEYPNKLNQAMADSTHLASPKELHPAFYGCFDWHSAVHGHWTLVNLIRQYPSLNQAAAIRSKLVKTLSAKNILGEVAYFKLPGNASFERTYGWAWVLKLAEELHAWEDPLARDLEKNLQPLTDYVVQAYLEFIPKLAYAIRAGEHGNTAFGLSMAWDYAQNVGNKELQDIINESVQRFYSQDRNCSMAWEPSGFDFLSPCLEEANLVRKVYGADQFEGWFLQFMPELSKPGFKLEPGKVTDRADGKLVHLDGLNFSRARCLYGIAETLPQYSHLKDLATKHLNYSLPHILDDNYSGTHWLASFALVALNAVH